jgi:hypothetical protein
MSVSPRQLDLSFAEAKKRPPRRSTTWRATAERLTRYRRCIRLDGGGSVVCEEPWQPGDSAFSEEMGPVRRPCPLCEVYRALTFVMDRCRCAERIAEEMRLKAMTYRELLESDRTVMRKVELGEQGLMARLGADAIALMLLREHGSVDAALKELTHEAYATDEVLFDDVRIALRLMHVPMGEFWERHAALTRGEP